MKEECWIKNAEDDNVSIFPVYFFYYAAYHDMPKVVGVQLKQGAMEFINHKFNFFAKMPDWKDAGAALTKKAIEDKDLFPKIRKLSIQYTDELVAKAEEIAKNEQTSATNEDLNAQLNELCVELQKKWSVGITHVLFDFDYTHITDKLIAILQKRTKDVQQTLSILTTPEEETTVKKEERIFLQLIEKAQKEGEEEIKELLKKHYETYKWIRHGWDGPDASFSYFEEKLKTALKNNINARQQLDFIEKNKKEIQKQREKLETELQLTEEEKRLFWIGRSIVYLKGYRKEQIFHVLSLVEPFMEEIGKRIQLSLAEVRFLTQEEITEGILKKKDFTEIAQKRKEHCVYFMDNGMIKILVDNEAREFVKNVKQTKVDPNIKELRGMCAQQGEAKGIVKHVATPEDMVKFNKGDILVSAATNPMIVPAMERAAAIITDEGGLTCHASIVSRELGVPCIIGTKIATKVLKEGEYVYVNATKGIIKKLQ